MSESKSETKAAEKPAQVTVTHENGEVRVIPSELLADFESRGFTVTK